MILKRRVISILSCSLIAIVGILLVYFLLSITGVIQVRQNTIVIRSETVERVYDGTTLKAEGYELVSGKLEDGHTPVLTYTASLTGVGECKNTYSLVIVDETNVDVTDRYEIEQLEGTLKVTKRPISITVKSKEFYYDGTSHSFNDDTSYTLSSGTLAENHTLDVAVSGEITNVGSTPNKATAAVFDADGNNVTENYDISITEGTLSVVKIEIYIKTASSSKPYDGTPLSNAGFTQTKGVLLYGHYLKGETSGEITDVGTTGNKFSCRIEDENGVDVSINYDIIVEEGTLTVQQRELILTAKNHEKDYDGKPFDLTDPNEVNRSGTVLPTETLNWTVSGYIVDIGTINSSITYTIESNATGADVTKNYNVTVIPGILTINPRRLVIKAGSDSHEYNGNSASNESYEWVGGSLADGHNLVCQYSQPQNTIGSKDNVITSYQITDGSGKIVTSNYDVECQKGTLELKAISLTIKSNGRAKPYDGEFLSEESYALTGKVLEELGHSLNVFDYKQIVNASTEANTFTYTITDRNGSDVSGFYLVNAVYGELKIEQAKITITSESKERAYDGTPLSINNVEVTAGKLADNDELRYTTNAVVEGVDKVTNTISSYGIYNGSTDVTKNYDITVVEGTLSVIPRDITIYTNSYEFEYSNEDRSYLSYDEERTLNLIGTETINVISGTIVHNVTTTAVNNELVFEIKIDNQDVTRYYKITQNTGKLSVKPRTLDVYTDSDEIEYDGKDHSYGVVRTEGLLDGDNFTLLSENTYRDVEEYINTFDAEDYRITNEQGDVSSNYKVVIHPGSVKITRLTIRITSESDEREYNGKALENNVYYVYEKTATGDSLVTGDSLSTGDTLNITVSGSITDVGTTPNTINCEITNNLGRDVTKNYAITKIEGTLEITPCTISISTSGDSKEYDGTALVSNNYEIAPEDELKITNNNHSIEITVTGTQTVYGTSKNTFDWVIRDSQGNPVARSNYQIDDDLGDLVVNQRTITIVSDGGTKYYDGQLFSVNTAERPLKLLQNHHLVINPTNLDAINVGNYDNTFTVEIIDDNEAVVTGNYDITKIEGTLIINPLVIDITTGSATKDYDGESLSCTDWNYSAGSNSFIGNADLVVSLSTPVVNATTGTSNKFLAYKVLDGITDVTKNYKINFSKEGLLVINKKTITISSPSHAKVYDETPLTYIGEGVDACTIIGTTVGDDEITVTFTASITNVGSTSNSFTYAIMRGSTNVTDNYAVTVSFGTLTIASDSSAFEMTDGVLNQGSTTIDHDAALTVTSTTSSTLYLRYKSFGDYKDTLNGFEDMSVSYNNTYGINPLLLTTRSLMYSGYNTLQSVTVEKERSDYPYFLPMYSSNISSLNDVIVSESGRSYSVDYLSYNGNYSDVSLNPEDASFESDYYSFVLANYMTVPASTRASLEVIATDSGLSVNSSVEDIANYIRNSAVYNLNFRAYPEGVDYAVHFLTVAKEGVCAQFALAATLMYRTLGYPARYVTGFVCNTKAGEEVVVTQDKSHAWVEVYIESLGWITVEVTGSASGDGSNYENILTVKPMTINKQYNGSLITCDNSNITYSSLPEGYNIECEIEGGRITVGEAKTEIVSIKITNGDGLDVTDQFRFILEEGKLVVSQKKITITTTSDTKEYDGIGLTNDGYTFDEEQLVLGHYEDVVTNGRITEAGTVNNTANCTIYDAYGEDVTSQYDISWVHGTLTVTQTLIITPETVSQLYDGNAVSAVNRVMGFEDLTRRGFTYSVVVSGTSSELGVSESVIENFSIFKDGVDVTDNYNIIEEKGIIQLYKAIITVTTNTISKQYDGLAIDNSGYSIDDSNVYQDDRVICSVCPSITDVSTIANEIDVKVEDRNGLDITHEYKIIKTIGTLTITPVSISITLPEFTEKEYDGTSLTLTQIDAIIEGLPNGFSITFDLIDNEVTESGEVKTCYVDLDSIVITNPNDPDNPTMNLRDNFTIDCYDGLIMII